MKSTMKALCALGALAAIFSPVAALCDESFDRALSLASEERYAEAREVLDPLLEREPGHRRARLLHGILRAHAGRVDEAIDIFEALRRDHPDMSEPYNNLAVLHAMQGRLDDAREVLLEALERAPAPVVYANLGAVYTKLARRAYRTAHELEAGDGSDSEQGMHTALALPETPNGSSDTEPRNALAEMLPVFCAHAGGFRSRRAVADAALWLQSYGVEVLEVRQEEHRIAGSYQVYLPPLADREKAVAKLEEIRRRGVRDVAVIPDGDLVNGISFGIYKEADNMHRRVAALGQLGYAVRSRAAGGEIASEYVIESRASGTSDALGASWAARFPEQPIHVGDCG